MKNNNKKVFVPDNERNNKSRIELNNYTHIRTYHGFIKSLTLENELRNFDTVKIKSLSQTSQQSKKNLRSEEVLIKTLKERVRELEEENF